MNNLSVFQVLKSGTSFSNRPRTAPSRKSSVDSTVQSFEKFHLQKYAQDDSESEPEAPIDGRRRRKESMDRIEQEMQKKQGQREARYHKLMRQHRIRVQGDDVPRLCTNFTKMMKYGVTGCDIPNKVVCRLTGTSSRT